MNASQRQEFCVRWNSHLGSIGAAFPQLLAGQRFVDVTLACEGHQVHCHRLVLAACSSYFDSILAENPCKHPVIILPSEIKLWEIQALVDFMYKGEVNVTQAGLPQLLRCAEQLRIRGLYGSDAALNLNQLKALTNKAAAAAAAATQQQQADGIETDTDTATNSTTTTTATAASALQQLHAGGGMSAAMMAQELQQQQQQQQKYQQQPTFMIKKEPIQQDMEHEQQMEQLQQQQLLQQQSNGSLAHSAMQQNHLEHQQQLVHQQQLQLQAQQQQQRVPQATLAHVANAAAAMAAASAATNSNANSEDDDSGDDSNSNQAYEEHSKYRMQQKVTANNMKATQAAAAAGTHLDSTIEDDHNYVAAHDEDSSYCASADTEHESSANASLLNMLAAQANSGAANTAEMSGSLKRVRRSEASLAQAAKCVSKGQTFQTVSNMFNIPVSTIRFYMARKGILPRRKRGRGASSAVSSVTAGSGGIMTATAAATMAQALSQMKRAESPSGFPAHQLVSGASVGGKAHI
ncbi:protein bric-a-brac 2 [Bactrocera tryoni]|uniref:protein bric-a-brac 2 n=1 Tax=Bactrocera tryoni TaxID=59916 RepID=UPI001A98A45C|nr:protein bric-a-brac 2 [Bactrocera tryoni]XP_039960961.1 protein bric-a-brac 2 [Bactrocera tryoni]XP_039960962.1 protein bric-a-brac 2 [Bactrocera tryoni]XP_039960963.1 protein bric-a-brac 2 [Bactrocera tryoni]XP_039960964.1 protein bric-a-brac 2 [Bactrocera tryoni]